jgi:hypothetical protein
LRLLSCYQAVGCLRAADPAPSFANRDLTKKQVQRADSSFRTDSLQSFRLIRARLLRPNGVVGSRPATTGVAPKPLDVTLAIGYLMACSYQSRRRINRQPIWDTC